MFFQAVVKGALVWVPRQGPALCPPASVVPPGAWGEAEGVRVCAQRSSARAARRAGAAGGPRGGEGCSGRRRRRRRSAARPLRARLGPPQRRPALLPLCRHRPGPAPAPARLQRRRLQVSAARRAGARRGWGAAGRGPALACGASVVPSGAWGEAAPGRCGGAGALGSWETESGPETQAA